MVANSNWIQVLFLLCCITYSYCNCSCDSATHDGQTCVDYFSIVETALLSNGSNIYKLRELLLKDPPELLNVTFYLQFINKKSSTPDEESSTPDEESSTPNEESSTPDEESSIPDELPVCPCSADDTSNLTRSAVFRNTTGTVVLRYGWTSIGVYSYIHPALLNQLQIQLPFYVLRTFVNNNHPFLWNGYNQLPSIHLYLSIPITNLTCLPYTDQLDRVIKRLTSLLMHYVRSEHRLSDSHIPIQADYALDGQFVSNWEDTWLHSGYKKRLFLKPYVGFISSHFFKSLFIIQCTANYFVQNMLFIVTVKLIQHYRSKFKQDAQNPTIFSSAISLYISVCICLILFGIAMFATELSYINNFSSDYFLVQSRLISIFFSFGYYTLFGIIIFCCTCNTPEQQNLSNYILFKLLECVDFFSVFAISWIVSSLYATLLYSLAYPIYVIILITLHVTIFIITTIVLAAFVPGVISCWNKYTDTHVFLRFIFICCTSIFFVAFAAGVSAAIICSSYLCIWFYYCGTNFSSRWTCSSTALTPFFICDLGCMVASKKSLHCKWC